MGTEGLRSNGHYAERAIWYPSYDFKKEKRNQPEGNGKSTVSLCFCG